MGRWILAHPGRFTHDQQFTGTTFLKMLLYALGGGVRQYQGGFDSLQYAKGSAEVFGWLERHRPAFWREGSTYPPGVAELHRLFANREVDFSMSYNQNEVVTKVRQGILPATARPLLLQDGTIANTHFVGIPFNAAARRGGDGGGELPALARGPAGEAEARGVGRRDGAGAGPVAAGMGGDGSPGFPPDPRALPPDSLAKYARPEVSPRYHERLSADWRVRVRQAGK